MSEKGLEVRIARGRCMGSRVCVRTAPGVFRVDAEGKACAHDPNAEPEEAVLAAGRGCPTFAIEVTRDGRPLV